MALIKKENIVTTEKYQKNGEEKTIYHKVGEIVTMEGRNGGKNKFLKLYQNPDVKYLIFEDKPKTDNDLPY